MKKIILIVVGCISLALGSIGAAIPLLPSFPFLLLAGICFAKSSQKLNSWFVNTKLYKNNLESFRNGEGMTSKTKIKVIALVTLTMGFGFYFMDGMLAGRIILAAVWVFHLLYFTLIVKTKKIDVSQCHLTKKSKSY